MTSPQRPRAAATPTASPEGVTAELLPCPFCGSAMKYYEADGKKWWSHPTWEDRSKDKDLLIYCPSYAWRAFTDEHNRVAGWNRRTPALAAQAQRRDEVVEALRAALEPFAREAERIHPDWADERRRVTLTPSKELTVGDFRRAHSILNTPEPK